jgi:hypothetical protein
MSTTTRGSCLCGAVTFSVAPPYRWFAHCHCAMCRKQHGSLFGTSVGVARAAFRWVSGADDVVRYRASAAFERPFCRHCGANVPAVSHDERYWHVPAGLLDDSLYAKPRSHIFVASRSPLTELDDGLPRHEAYPRGIAAPTVALPREHDAAAALGGSCLCGGIVFAASEAPRRVVNCYCSLCRRSRAAAFSSTLLVAATAFRFVAGAERVRRFAPPAPRQYATEFCADCGSPAPSAPAGSPTVMLPAGAIDTPLAPLPAVHLHVGSKAGWYDIPGPWPQFAELPPAERFAEFFE